MRIGVRKLLRTGLVLARAWERTSRWYPTNRKAEIVKADGSSNRKEGVGVAISFLEVNNWEVSTFHHGHAFLNGRCLVAKMGKGAVEGLEEADL